MVACRTAIQDGPQDEIHEIDRVNSRGHGVSARLGVVAAALAVAQIRPLLTHKHPLRA